MLGLVLLTAPIGYVILTGYLLYKIQPFPITILPANMLGAADYPRREGLAA
ncbi:MAG: hypothetical protein ABIP58_04870 [Dehalococcoidia bacterium]